MSLRTEEEILKRYHEGTATEKEKELVESWILNGADFGFDLTDEELLEDLINIRQRLDLHQPKTKTIIWKRVAVAASVILLTALSILLFQTDNKKTESKSNKIAQNDRAAGENLATLTLSDGSTIKLDSTLDGKIKEKGFEIANDANGNITYIVKADESATASAAFNTITTPRGGTYKIILPDGTKVWLNAASSLRFPLSFDKDARKVELTGEGYFEVAKSGKRFRVTANDATIEVLGTHFNINSYSNEKSTDVTLLEGSIKVSGNNSSAILKPGEQGVMPHGSALFVTDDIDTQTITAWKDGAFKFNNTDLKTIMRQIERWYDVDVDENTIPNKKFNGTISRDVKLSEVLSMIELTSNLNFNIQGRNVTMQ